MNKQYIYGQTTVSSDGDDSTNKGLDEQRKLCSVLSDCIRVKRELLRSRTVCFVLLIILTAMLVAFAVLFRKINGTLFFSVIIVFAAFYVSVISFCVSVYKKLHRNRIKIESIEKRIVEIG